MSALYYADEVRSLAVRTSEGALELLNGNQTMVLMTRFLLDRQKENGDLRADAAGSNAGMYVHGQASIVLCEAFYMTGDQQLPLKSTFTLFAAASQEFE